MIYVPDFVILKYIPVDIELYIGNENFLLWKWFNLPNKMDHLYTKGLLQPVDEKLGLYRVIIPIYLNPNTIQSDSVVVCVNVMHQLPDSLIYPVCSNVMLEQNVNPQLIDLDLSSWFTNINNAQ
jgi:hypothetical protein